MKAISVVVALLAHRLAEADDLDRLQQLGVSLQRVDHRQLAALAAGEFEERDFGFGGHHSASPRCLISA